MARRKVHWRPPSAALPRARCGSWIGTALLTRDRAAVTCGRCRRLMGREPLAIEAIRGRPMEVTYRDGQLERGALIDAVATGLTLCRHSDGARVLAAWPRIARARFIDHAHADEKEPDEMSNAD